MNTENYLDTAERILFSAVRIGDLERVKMIMDNGGDIDAIDSEGRSLLDVAEQNGHEEIEEYLKGYCEQ